MAEHARALLLRIIGSLPVDLIDGACIRSVLDPVWIEAKKPHVGARLRERLELILEFAKARGLRQGENPAKWRGGLEHSYAGIEISTQNLAALPFGELPALMQELAQLPGVAARALQFLILTASRTARDALRPLVGDRPCGARLGRSRGTHEGREGAQGAVVGSGAGDPRGASARRRG